MRVCDITPELIAYTMSEAEQEQINAAQDPIKAFTELWTRKEAYVKFLGTGLAGVPGNPRQYLDHTADATLVTKATDKYAYTICTKS